MAYRKLGRDNKHRRSMLARSARAFLHNDTKVVDKIFNDLAKRFEKRDGGYTRILKVDERRGDGALISIIELVK